MKKNVYKEYCTGCGLCCAKGLCEADIDEKGFLYPLKINDESFLKNVCPAGGMYQRESSNIWGSIQSVYLGWSNEKDVRDKASSGGILTEIAIYLLERHIVDGVIQTRAKNNNPIETETVVSCSVEEVKGCAGSRYTISSPLLHITELIEKGKKYAFIGKPCDVMALRQYMLIDEDIKDQIVYLLSFFCAGVPSKNANLSLLKKLGCKSPGDCKSLTYRGNGWPGFATAINSSGQLKQISYDESWGKILGRDVRKACRFCIDGIGDAADITCGDAWYINEEGKPDFSEAEGRNVIIARTKDGFDLISNISKVQQIHIEKYINYRSELPIIQYYQFQRRATMKSMIDAMRLFGKVVPHYNRKILNEYSRNVNMKINLKRFAGVCKRIMKGKIE